MSLAVAEVAGFKLLAEDENAKRFADFANRKASEKERISKIIAELSKVSPEVKEANRIIFTGLMNQYSKDTIAAGTGGK